MNNIHIDLDENIIKYLNERLDNNINIEKSIKDIVSIALTKNKISIDTASISIQSATRDEIKDLNSKYRNIDRPTDVLSFPIFEREELESIKDMEESKKIKELELGDIILCLDIINEQSKEYETGLLREVLYMITHGVCHLLGYDHIEEDDKKEMRDLEEYILNKLGVFKSNEK